MTCLSRPLSNLQFFEKDKIILRNRRVGCCAVRETDPGKNRAHGGHALSQTQDKGDEACATIWGSAAGPLTENGGGGQARSWKAPTWGQCLLRPSSQGRAESSCARRRRRWRRCWGLAGGQQGSHAQCRPRNGQQCHRLCTHSAQNLQQQHFQIGRISS